MPSPDAAKVYRYQLVIEGDEYGLLSSLVDIAEAALKDTDATVQWNVRSDEEVDLRAR